jgi:hypothetical protein
MENSVKSNLKNLKTWERFLYMILFAIVLGVVKVVLFAVILLQVILTLFTRSQNERTTKFGGQLGLYACQIFHFLTYYSESRPFPFSDWPSLDKTEEAPVPAPPSSQDVKPTPKPVKRVVRRVKKKENEKDLT